MIIISNYTPKRRKLSVDNLGGYADFMKNTFGNMTPKELSVWAAKQAYIAMSNLLTACAELKIDACPIEGFKKDAYDEILNLKHQKLESTVLVAVGYRSSDDKAQFENKVRLPDTEIFI